MDGKIKQNLIKGGHYDSFLLFKEHGYSPIGYTKMYCDEVYIFRNLKEAERSLKHFQSLKKGEKNFVLDGYFTSYEFFWDTRYKYENNVYEGGTPPEIFWLLDSEWFI